MKYKCKIDNSQEFILQINIVYKHGDLVISETPKRVMLCVFPFWKRVLNYLFNFSYLPLLTTDFDYCPTAWELNNKVKRCNCSRLQRVECKQEI